MSELIIVGASLAGLRFAEAARRAGYDGNLRMVGAEDHLPYDRPPMSKKVLTDPEWSGKLEYKDEDYYRGLEIDLILGSAANSLDPGGRTVTLDNGTRLGYERLVIATGSHARHLPETSHLDGVLTLRTQTDAFRLREAFAQGGEVVVIGSGFIGSEVAAAARARGLNVTIVEALSSPLVRIVEQEIGERLQRIHTDKGTKVLCGVGVDKIIGETKAQAVQLTDGTVLPADFVVCGVGALPATDWLEGSGLEINNGVVANSRLEVGPNLYAVGDVVNWEHELYGSRMRIEHWTNASEQGMAAARNVFGTTNAPYIGIPYFWSDWYDNRIQFVGIPKGQPKVLEGGLDSERFIAAYRDNDRIVGAISLNWPSRIMRYRSLIATSGTWQAALDMVANEETSNV